MTLISTQNSSYSSTLISTISTTSTIKQRDERAFPETERTSAYTFT